MSDWSRVHCRMQGEVLDNSGRVFMWTVSSLGFTWQAEEPLDNLGYGPIDPLGTLSQRCFQLNSWLRLWLPSDTQNLLASSFRMSCQNVRQEELLRLWDVFSKYFMLTISTAVAMNVYFLCRALGSWVRKTPSACQQCWPESFCESGKFLQQAEEYPDLLENVQILYKISR